MVIFNSYIKIPEGITIFGGITIHQPAILRLPRVGFDPYIGLVVVSKLLIYVDVFEILQTIAIYIYKMD